VIPWYVFAIGAAICASVFSLLRKKVLSKEHAMNFESARTLSVALIVLLLIPLINFSMNIKVIGLVYVVSLIATIGI